MAAAGPLLLAPRLRPGIGPALRPGHMPVTATVLSVVCHGALAALLVVAATVWNSPPTKTYVVNLVPAVAAVGTPQGQRAPSPRPEPPPRVTRREPAELPEREPSRAPAPVPARPAPIPDLPARPLSLPDAPSRSPSLPDRALPPRPPSTPRTGEKELPAVASAPRPPAPALPAPAATASAQPAPPPPPVGRPSGSAQGTSAMTLEVTDFPFAWYLAAVQRKITDRWESRALQGRQPVVVFEIARDGRVSNVSVKQSSGNSYYDRAAIGAITDAAPFPRLPDEWPRPSLVIQLGFNFALDRG